MNVGKYTFAEFKAKAAEFHGYPAPGLLVGGYMVEMAKKALPDGALFEALVESKKCLPDAVQLLTLCSVGNNWMKVLNLGRYAVSLYDKFTGQGVRVHLDQNKLKLYPEIQGWFMKLKPKSEQDTDELLREIEEAGESICTLVSVRVKKRFLGHAHMSGIAVCPLCDEAYPLEDGILCRGCQGEAPYAVKDSAESLPPLADASASPRLRVVPLEEAVGKNAAHDMTQIIPGEFKGAVISAGQIVSAGDMCRLQQMGRFNVAVLDGGSPGKDWGGAGWVHENDAAEAFAQRMAGPGISYGLPPKEGKINFRAETDGLFCVDVDKLYAFNMIPEIMLATRQDATLVGAGSEVAGTRAIPLFISQDRLSRALAVLGDNHLLSVRPLRRGKVGILVTGTEVFNGLIKDRFAPLISAKVEALGCEVVKSVIVPDDTKSILDGVAAIEAAGADLLVTTGGLSVDPDDLTRSALVTAGLSDILHGVPVLPGAMSLVGRLRAMRVIGVPACALYFKTTLFDSLLPRLLANREITRPELARMGEGGFCMNCKVCTYPKCFFMK